MAGGRPGRRARSAGEARAGAPSSPSRRRSERNLPSSARPVSQDKPSGAAKKTMSSPRPGPSVMRTITLKKIKPWNQQDRVKDSASVPRRSPRISLKEDKENSPPGATENQSPPGVEAKKKPQSPAPCCSLNLDTETQLKGTDTPFLLSADTQDSLSEREWDLAMAKRVRRSYSRLDVSLARSFLEKEEGLSSSLTGISAPTCGPGKRQTLFGFEKLLLPGQPADHCPLNTSSAPHRAAAETSAFAEPDTDIPGISFGREKRRKKKMPQFDKLELDEWAAQMNAEFEEAERFDLLVE